MSKSGFSDCVQASTDEKRPLVTVRYGKLSAFRAGLTAISLAQPPKNCVLYTQCPAVTTVRGPTSQPVPIAPAPMGPRISQRADHPPWRQLGVENADALVDRSDDALEPRAGRRRAGQRSALALADEVPERARGLGGAARVAGGRARRHRHLGRHRLEPGGTRFGLAHGLQLDHASSPPGVRRAGRWGGTMGDFPPHRRRSAVCSGGSRLGTWITLLARTRSIARPPPTTGRDAPKVL